MLNDKYHIQLSYFSVLAYFHGQADYFVFFCLIFIFFANMKQIERNNTAKIHKKKYNTTKKQIFFFVFKNKKEISRNLHHIMKLLQLSFVIY